MVMKKNPIIFTLYHMHALREMFSYKVKQVWTLCNDLLHKDHYMSQPSLPTNTNTTTTTHSPPPHPLNFFHFTRLTDTVINSNCPPHLT